MRILKNILALSILLITFGFKCYADSDFYDAKLLHTEKDNNVKLVVSANNNTDRYFVVTVTSGTHPSYEHDLFTFAPNEDKEIKKTISKPIAFFAGLYKTADLDFGSDYKLFSYSIQIGTNSEGTIVVPAEEELILQGQSDSFILKARELQGMSTHYSFKYDTKTKTQYLNFELNQVKENEEL